ncbi:MAG TPA: hypothetical protein VI357_11450 [Mycobacteriales bacterium]
MIASAVGAGNIPAAARELSSVPRVDYADRFVLATDADGSPEDWARAMFGDVPSAGELFIWRGLLGLRLSRGRSPDTVAGWLVGGRGDTWIRLTAASWFLTANLLVQTAPGRVALTTFVHYARPPAPLVWPPLSAVHRRLVPGVLTAAAERVRVHGRALSR